MQADREFEVVSFDDAALLDEMAEAYYQLRRRRGLARELARVEMRRNATLIGAMLVRQERADGMLCGTFGTYDAHLKYVSDVIGLRQGSKHFAAMNVLMLPQQTVFICDTYINPDPNAALIAEMTLLAAEAVRRFGLTPRAALLSHSNFGSADTPSALKMREALELVGRMAPDLEVEGEMHGDAALSKGILDRVLPDSRLSAAANLLVMPNLDAANITYNVLKVVAGQGVTVGPILLGAAQPVHVMTPTSTVRRIINMTALAAVDAATQAGGSSPFQAAAPERKTAA
jgi:malate dehydrogenase (oxaloacetate-decarboxylating)(NADP+)